MNGKSGMRHSIFVLILMLCIAVTYTATVWREHIPQETMGETIRMNRTDDRQGDAGTEPEQGQPVEETEEKERREEEKALDNALHARAAVLVDMESGRILYEKNGGEVLPMASTTKIMTCILTLEEAGRDETVTASAYAAGQPKVHLGMQKGMSYVMDDLLHSLMLESHNDAAVAIAEHIGGKGMNLPDTAERSKEESRTAVTAFCERMTEKAREIGCRNTRFLTPNGLDAQAESTDGETIVHATTAADLARIMSYCINESPQREAFLEITRAASHSFSDCEGKRTYVCNNHNAFLNMMDGALSGKTGFTNQAGYCYVGALEQDGKKLALALLACGWPNHKTWKWADSRQLFTYRLERFSNHEFSPAVDLAPIPVAQGAADSGNPYEKTYIRPQCAGGVLPICLMVRETESVEACAEMEKTLTAPVEAGTQIGTISYYLTDEYGERQYLAEEAVYAGEDVAKIDFAFVFRFIRDRYLL